MVCLRIKKVLQSPILELLPRATLGEGILVLARQPVNHVLHMKTRNEHRVFPGSIYMLADRQTDRQTVDESLPSCITGFRAMELAAADERCVLDLSLFVL